MLLAASLVNGQEGDTGCPGQRFRAVLLLASVALVATLFQITHFGLWARHVQGASPTPWGIWTRAWTAEENRHGDTMNKYMYLSGKVNMKARRPTCSAHTFNARCSYRRSVQPMGCIADGARSSVPRP